jgi:hypothetical protein
MLRLVQLAAAAASLAPLSQAFLLPPTVSSVSSVSIDNNALLDAFHHSDVLSVALPCAGCPVMSTVIDGVVRDPGPVENYLEFNLTFTRGKQGDTLLLNGHQAYPFDPLSELFQGTLHAYQYAKVPSGIYQAGLADLGYAIAIHHHVEKAGDPANPLNIVEIRLKVIDMMGGHVVGGMSVIQVKLLETPSRALMLGDVQLAPSTTSMNPSKFHQLNQCSSLRCAWKAWKASLKDKLSKHKGCAGMRPHHMFMPFDLNKAGHTDRPHHSFHPSHHHNHHHHKQSGFGRFLRGAVLRVLIPVMIGLALGATASVIGIVVGHIVGHIAIFIWRVLFRRGQSASYTRVESDDTNDDDEDDETKAFLANGEAPPVYEHAPVYEEVTPEKPSE